MKSIGTEFTKKLPRTMPSSPKYLTNTNKGIITQKGDYAMFKKLDKLEQDLTEVRGGLYDLKENTDLDFKAINILLGILEDSFYNACSDLQFKRL